MLSFPEAAKVLRFHRPHIVASADAEDATPLVATPALHQVAKSLLRLSNEIPLPLIANFERS